MLPEADIAYTAGILDGEGCIEIKKDTYGLCVAVGNTDFRLLDWLAEHWGGNVYNHARQTIKHYPRSKPFGQWQIYGKRAIAMLEVCSPYMLLKKDRVEVALKMKILIYRKNNYLPGFNEEMRHRRHAIYLELKAMNKRGIAA